MFCALGLVFGGTEGIRSCFPRSDSFSAVPRASSPVFKFCAPGLVFESVDCVGSRFHVLRVRSRFQQYRGRGVPFSCFSLPDSFLAVPRASGLVFMFCALRLFFGGTEGVGSRFHVLRARTRFRRYGGIQIPFSGFARPNSFSAVPRASGPVFRFCAPGLIFGGIEGVGSRLHVFRFRTRFWQYRGRRVPFSCFARPDSFSVVPSASGSVFKFCAPRIIFGGIEGVRSRFQVLRFQTRFRRDRGRRDPFSCFALPDSFSAVPLASGPVLMFCALVLVFGGTVGVGSRFSCFNRLNSFLAVPGDSDPVFKFCAPGLVFGGIEGVGSRFHVLRTRTRFLRYGRIRVPL
jgi:hypothetical protein